MNEGVRLIAEALQINQSITSIQLGCVGTVPVLKAIAEALRVNNSITLLSLKFYKEKNESVEWGKIIAEVLKSNHSITAIKLHDFGIDDEGIRNIANALKLNDSITSISLGQNHIGSSGEKAIAEALKVNHSIISMIFKTDDDIEEFGAIAEALMINQCKCFEKRELDEHESYVDKRVVRKEDPSVQIGIPEIVPTLCDSSTTLFSLLGMGYSQERSLAAMQESSTIEGAIEWLAFSQAETTGPASIEHSQVQQLVLMGFDQELATAALLHSGDNLEKALDWLHLCEKGFL
eukprot:TRINITY_DN562_c0_g1_i2.p1 TRINITY_DN562_c0_g1~~TRINITY_DN562_c0_g1_i2.p1  ORF type:complete len:291 (+),score=60.22 TRINITY_DN562_c0_g1_i2:889-1761(+)